ncbi:related to NADH oxidase [Rhynchosporium agropyri]|uniref:Related to NADH oxidase n=1 Tax=Rhynchosporium agropyri TaxID=914238 RepID=A0A1E1LAJ6_9HELO|nr:related to NADH oxidase [Rhynchosporium agropyri]
MQLSEKIELPCGLVLPNRLAKAAMAESMAKDHTPGKEFVSAYGEWADGGWGMIITGNVIVNEAFHGSPGDVELSVSREQSPEEKAQWKNWGAVCQRSGTPTVIQLCHPGRQSPYGAGSSGLFQKTVAPSAVKLNLGDSVIARTAVSLLFGTPRELTHEEITGPEGIIAQFVAASKQCYEAGFKGVELHASHGYLLAQFMSPMTNLRTDDFGGTATKRVEIVLRIIREVRKQTSPEFCIGIKLNSVDAASSESLEEVMEQIRLINEAGVDFAEISGGTYENPRMMQDPHDAAKVAEKEPKTKQSTLLREAFFLQFAQEVRASFPKLVLMVTGGLRTRLGMEAALKTGGCDLIGIARPAAVLPKLPKEIILNETISDEDASVVLAPIPVPGWIKYVPVKALGAGLQSKYYAEQIRRMAKGLSPVDTRI